MGLIKLVISIAVGAILLVAGIGAILYVTDTPVKATITDKECRGNPLGSGETSDVTITTKFPIPGIVYTLTDFSDQQCAVLRDGEDGNYVEYNIKSQRVVFYEREGGQCIYDSETGVAC